MNTVDTLDKAYISISEAARRLGVSRQFVRKLIADGKLDVERNHLYAPNRGPARVSTAQVEALKAST